MCYNREVSELSAPSLAERVAQVRADAAVTGGSGTASLWALLDELATTLDRQQTEMVQLRAQNRDLRRQFDRHSGNSSQPPSQDGPQHRPRRRRRPQDRPRGGQPGHPGRTLRAVPTARVDQVVDHWPAHCDRCRARLPGGRAALHPSQRGGYEAAPTDRPARAAGRCCRCAGPVDAAAPHSRPPARPAGRPAPPPPPRPDGRPTRGRR